MHTINTATWSKEVIADNPHCHIPTVIFTNDEIENVKLPHRGLVGGQSVDIAAAIDVVVAEFKLTRVWSTCAQTVPVHVCMCRGILCRKCSDLY